MEEQFIEKAFGPAELIMKYLMGGLSVQQQAELDAWIEASDENRVLFNELTNPQQLGKLLTEFHRYDSNKKAAYQKLKQRLFPRTRVS